MTDDPYQLLRDSAEQSDRLKMKDVENDTFTIHAAKLQEFRNRNGEDDAVFVGTVSFDDGRTSEIWLDGNVVENQVRALINAKRLPIRVKAIRNTDKTGVPWELVAPDGAVTEPVAASQTPQSAAPQGAPSVDGLPEAMTAWKDAWGGAQGVARRLKEEGLPGAITAALVLDDKGVPKGWNTKGLGPEALQELKNQLVKDTPPAEVDELPFE